RSNRAGADIGKLDNYGLKVTHDMRRMLDGGKKKWMADIAPHLDMSKMDVDDAELSKILDKAFDRITTDGAIDQVPGATFGGGKVANRGSESRQLHFKDGDAWLEYQDAYGSKNMFSSLTDSFEGYASNIALMEKMGPNPETTFKHLRSKLDLDMKKNDVGLKTGMVDGMWNIVSGKAGAITKGEQKFAQGAAGVRNVLVATKLGSATLSAISDSAFSGMTRHFNGLSSTKALQNVVMQLNPTSSRDRMFARQMGIVADSILDHSAISNRFGETDGLDWTAKLAGATMRASGLQGWSEGNRNAFSLTLAYTLQDNAGLSYRAMSNSGAKKKRFVRMLKRYNISSQDWDEIRQTPPVDHRETQYMPFRDIESDVLRAKVLQMVNEEMDFAVPTPDAFSRNATTWGGKRAGTFGKGSLSTLSSPVVGLIEDVVNLPLGNLQELADGEDTNFLRESVKLAQKLAPGQLWYTRLIMQRMIFDQLELMADPSGAKKSFNRMERKYKKEYGAESYWKRGDILPGGT
ncbi:hypothetical protein, partial [Solemya elarraichensis gill symbiont]